MILKRGYAKIIFMMKFDFEKIKKEGKEKIKKAKNLEQLKEIFDFYFGKEGKISLIFKSLKEMGGKEKKKIGQIANELKNFLKREIEKKENELKEKLKKEIEEREWLDISLPGKKPELGHLHPLTLITRKIVSIFQSMGFSVVEGPEIENEWYNFDALNIPKEHPARDLWDTLYLKNNFKSENKKNGKFLLRTHTSPVQIRYLEKHQPPFKIIAPGRVFRHEATDSKHEINFHQIEGLMVAEKVSVPHFKAIISHFLNEFFQKKVKMRLRPSFFPFTEPSFEIDILCVICQGKGCSTCLGSGYLEIMGAGMVHPNVFKNSGLNPKFWKGFAFGLGLERMAMLKYKIDDIRLFFSGDLRFLKQF